LTRPEGGRKGGLLGGVSGDCGDSGRKLGWCVAPGSG